MSRRLDADIRTMRLSRRLVRRPDRQTEDPMVDRKKNKNVDSDREEIEADRQKDTSQWARAFGVSSDDLRGATALEDPLEHDELDPEKKGAK